MKIRNVTLVKEKGLVNHIENVVTNIDKYKIEPRRLGEGYERMKISKKLIYNNIAIKAVESGTIVFFYIEGDKNTLVPFIPLYNKEKRVFKCLINIKPFLNDMDNVEDGQEFDIDEKKLHNLILGGFGAISGIMNDAFKNSPGYRDTVIQYQAALWLSVLNRVSSIGTSEKNTSHFKYIFAKWILASMYEKNDVDNINGAAYKIAMGVEDEDRAIKFDMTYDIEELSQMTFSDFLKLLEKEFPQLERKVDLEFILRNANISYSSANILALEYPIYAMILAMGYPDDFCIYKSKIFNNELLSAGRNTYNTIAEQVMKTMYASLGRSEV